MPFQPTFPKSALYRHNRFFQAQRPAALKLGGKLIASLACACMVLSPLGQMATRNAFGTIPPLYAQQDEGAQNDTHVVGVGETLSQIAQTYQISQADLMRINGIQDANAIYVGQELLLPPRPDEAEPPPIAPSDEADQAPLLPQASHTVQRGETLRSIADTYGIDIVELMNINFISDADNINVGQVLELPTAPDDATTFAEEPDSPATTESTREDAVDEAPTSAEEDAVDAHNAEPTGDDESESTDEPTQPDIDAVPENSIERMATLNQTYTVEAGDSPSRVALRTGVSLEALLALNRLSTYDMLAEGQTLILPATFAELQVVGAMHSAAEAELPNADQNIHVVQYGETLNMIAQEYEITLPALMTANLLRNPDMVSAGQALRIPDPAEALALEEAAANSDDAGAQINQTTALPEIGLPRRGYYFYSVEPGDTTAKIALQFDSTPLAIKEFNGLPNEETVYMGLELQIPYGPPPLPGTRPGTPVSGTSFVVSLSRQQCWVMRGERVLYAWLCSTGYGQWTTRMGSFAVQTRLEMAKSYAYSLDMPYWLGIYDVGTYENGIHGLPLRWDTGEKIWEGLIGRPATYGCAMLDDIQAKQLFDLSFLGMPVHIMD